MSFLDDEFDVSLPDAPEVPDVPDTPSVPDAPTDTSTPDVPNAPDAPDTPSAGAPNTPELPTLATAGPVAPSVQVQQDIADLHDNSDLDTVKGSGPAATESTKATPPESNTQTLAKQTIGADNMSRAPGTTPYTPADFVRGGPSATTTPQSGGIISGAMDWAKANPALAAALITTGAGALGGAGKAALDKSTMEKKSQLELANAEDLFAYKQQQSRDFSAAGAVQQPNLMQPNQGIINGGLRRPGGAGVFGSNGRLQR